MHKKKKSKKIKVRKTKGFTGIPKGGPWKPDTVYDRKIQKKYTIEEC